MQKLTLLFILFCLSVSMSWTQPNLNLNPNDKKAEVLINKLMKSLLIEDFQQSAIATKAHVHKSLLNSSGTALTRDLLDFSFKKAHANAKFYLTPVHFTRITENKITAIAGEKYINGGRHTIHTRFLRNPVFNFFSCFSSIAKTDGSNFIFSNPGEMNGC